MALTVPVQPSWHSTFTNHFHHPNSVEQNFSISSDDLTSLNNNLRQFLQSVPPPSANQDTQALFANHTATKNKESQPTLVRPSLNENNEEEKKNKRNKKDEKGQPKIFHWSLLNEGRSSSSFFSSSSDDDHAASDRSNDDGVVLLVGLFNLLAVVVYAGQQLLAGALSGSDKRVVFWQVQKVLDELVLRVHSSDTAANLLSRAFKSSTGVATARELSPGVISTFLLHAFSENDPRKTKALLNNLKDNLLTEISSSHQIERGPRIDPKVYTPLVSLYRKATESSRQGRDFSSSLLEEATSIAKTLSNMKLSQIQNALRALNQLGKMHKHYDILSMLKKIVPSSVVTDYGTETVYNSRVKRDESVTQFVRGALPDRRLLSKFANRVRQRHNSRFPRFSKSLLQYTARRMKEMAEAAKTASPTTPKPAAETTTKMATPLPKPTSPPLAKPPAPPSELMKRQGTVESVRSGTTKPTNWADGWFTLLTEASPVALDLSTLYSRARAKPYCLRALLCKANGYWRKRGVFQATLSPFFSVLAGWAMEDQSAHSLGDSLIAVRAGWMGKACANLYPDCTLKMAPHPLAEQALNFFNSVKKVNDLQTSATKFASKSGEMESDNEINATFKTAPTEPPPPPPPPQPTNPPPKHTDDIQHTKDMNTPPEHQDSQPTEDNDWSRFDDLFYNAEPYDRYDNPYYPDNSEVLTSESVTGMALQDRPVEKIHMKKDINRININRKDINRMDISRMDTAISDTDRMDREWQSQRDDEMYYHEALSGPPNMHQQMAPNGDSRVQSIMKKQPYSHPTFNVISYLKHAPPPPLSSPIRRPKDDRPGTQYSSPPQRSPPKWTPDHLGPSFLRESGYTSFMQSQQPAAFPPNHSPSHSHRGVSKMSQPNPHGHRGVSKMSQPNPHSHHSVSEVSQSNPHTRHSVSEVSQSNPHGHHSVSEMSQSNPHGHRRVSEMSQHNPHGHRGVSEMSQSNPHGHRGVSEMSQSNTHSHRGVSEMSHSNPQNHHSVSEMSQSNPQSHHSISKMSQPKRPTFVLPPNQVIKHPSAKKKPKQIKYKYGLRRGLPASNVNGHGPLLDRKNSRHSPKTAMLKGHKNITAHHTKPPKTKDISRRRYKHKHKNTTAAAATTTTPTTTTTPPPPPPNVSPLSREVSQFGPADAITDPLRNELLFQYIRDRHLSDDT